MGPLGAVMMMGFMAARPAWLLSDWAPLAVGLVVATLARDLDERLHGECAIKLLWVLGAACAMSWAGRELLTLATGTPFAREQWAVLELGLEPRFLWNTALPLSLLVGVVMLGAAPFHFWLADMFQGARPWLAPLAVVSLQVTGAVWLQHRLLGIETFPEGERLAVELLSTATVVACLAGAATLLVQRRPERRLGTLVSLQGALVVGMLAARRTLDPSFFNTWVAHLLLATIGASTWTRFIPVSRSEVSPGAPIFRRHPAAATAGLLGLFSLAGIPGTPVALLWLEVGRQLATGGRALPVLALAAAWLASVVLAFRQLREAIGAPGPSRARVHPVPLRSRMTLWISAVGLVGLAWWKGWR
jgi:NADH:ubiquinone oxidoreductase subunit 2 (subunit N)